ncbi:hypothetical protein PPS11_18085 [Pseudomonas putida S11]|nr:hypothetical protein PPS11_18085 [Pseudomonas putida S11]
MPWACSSTFCAWATMLSPTGVRRTATLAALEDQHAKLILELLHTDRQGRLAHVAAFGGMPEMLFLGECDDVA